MYSRGPRERQAVNVPENYSGNAFRNNIYTDIIPEGSQPETQTKQEHLPSILPTVVEAVAEEKPHKDTSHSVFSSLLPNSSSSSRFPFGHGIGFEEMLEAVNKNLSRLNSLALTYSTGHAVAEGVPTVILGRTNAGKSSLYNRILGRDAGLDGD